MACEAADLRRLHAGPLVGTDKLHPFRLELPQCRRFVLRAPLDISGRPALIAALSHNVECRYRVGDVDWRKRCQSSNSGMKKGGRTKAPIGASPHGNGPARLSLDMDSVTAPAG